MTARAPASIQQRLYDRLEREPNGKAIAFGDKKGVYDWIAYADFYQRAEAIADRLGGHGLQAGDVAIVVMPSDGPAATLTLAILLRGAVPLLVAPPFLQGLNSDLPRILHRTVRTTRARLVLGDETLVKMRDRLEPIRRQTRFLFGRDEIESAPPVAATDAQPTPLETDIAAMQLTSGTTGYPRICVWDHRGVIAAIDGMATAMKVGADDVYFNWTPLYHDMGLINNFVLCLTLGIPLAMLTPHRFVKRPALWLHGLATTGATTTWAPNFGFAICTQGIAESDLEGLRLDGVRGFWNAAERIHMDTMEAFQARFTPYGLGPNALKTNFGCAENIGGATFSDPDGPFVHECIDRAVFHGEHIARPVPADDDNAMTVVGVGRPHPGIRIAIRSAAGEELGDGEVGEIGLQSASHLLGYLGDAKSTARALKFNTIRTGDLGYMRNGEVFWVGRVTERIAVHGKKMDPSEFEALLLAVDGLRKGCFAAFGVDDETLGTQRIVVVSEVREPLTADSAALEKTIKEEGVRRLGVTINDVVLVRPGTLTKTSSGKRRHRNFRQMYTAGELDDFIIGRDDQAASAAAAGARAP